MSKAENIISSVSRQLYASVILKSFLVALTCGLLIFSFSSSWMLSGGSSLVCFLLCGYFLGLFSHKKQESIALIHKNLRGAEYSLGLLEVKEPNIAEQLQLERLFNQIESEPLPNVIFRGVMPYFSGVVLAGIIYFVYPYFNKESDSISFLQEKEEEAKTVNIAKPPVFSSSNVVIESPAYTKLPPKESTTLNISAVVGSSLKWTVKFNHSEKLNVKLSNSRGEELSFKNNGKSFEYSDKVVSSGLYGLKAYWKDSLIYQSDFYHLEAIPDLAPKIEPSTKELYTLHFLKDPKTLSISAKVSDDFLVKEVFVVATLARGSGENVKFREMKFPTNKTNFKSANVSKTIDLKALNFTPGDEFYYYWGAIDNKSPQANFTKSDTYFVVYKDTSAINEGELATMAVNILPEYFRSQRQIIIDTEKLIAKRNKVSKNEFNFTSNEIGFDQKALRIRYGQYLGEEYESSIGGGHAHGNEGGNLLDGFMHKHDSEEEGHHDHSHDHGHDHSHESKAPTNSESGSSLADILAEYVHSHDDAESNTFYEKSTRSLLKTALENMWQSELHLRLYEPEKALPFEKKALELLKEAQHKARTFISKSSYDPPPIKEKETRMKGELKKFNAKYNSKIALTEVQLQQLAGEVSGYLNLKGKLTSIQKQKVLLLSNQMSERIINSGLGNWAMLTSLRKLLNDKQLNSEETEKLKAGLFKLTGIQKSAESPAKAADKRLEKAFWDNL
jgi:hypothetical protein